MIVRMLTNSLMFGIIAKYSDLYEEKKGDEMIHTIMTKSGLEKLKSDLSVLKNKLKEIAERIKEARDLGDLSENSEYIEAKNEQSFLLGQVEKIEQKIKTAQIATKLTGIVSVGCRVEVESNGEKMEFEIVGAEEANPLLGRISSISPIGSALCGHKSGETVQAKTPAGITEFRILKVS